MLSNPLSQIERTKDAYVGRPQELEKRANVTKELVDLLAMQQLKKDLDAVKRNQMMQAQGNPMTIKDQMQQGLMGEYRQQAAKEMGVGPSETDIVQRAQQGMPQGMPQQQPRMAQGMMSQARPVQLASGGIVTFNKGESVEDGLTDAQREMKEFMERLAERRANAPLVPAFLTENTKSQIIARRRGSPVLDDVAERIAKANAAASGNTATALEGTPLEGALTSTLLPSTEREDTPASGIMLAGVPDRESKSAPSIQDRLDALKTTGIAADINPYTLDQKQRTQAESELGLNPNTAGLAAIDRIKRLSKMGENEKLLKDMQKRVQATYEETTPQGMDRLIDLLAAGGRGGITGVGIRSGQLRREEAERRRQLDQDIMGIQATTVELNRNFGADAAKAYADSEANVIAQRQNARNFLATADRAEVTSLMEKSKLTLDEQRNVRQLFTEQERNRLLGEQITATNSRALAEDISAAQVGLLELREEIKESVENDPKYADLRTLDPTDSSDARKIAVLEAELAADIASRSADIDDMADKLKVRQLEVQEQQKAQQRRLTPSPNIDLGEANALVEST